MDAFSLVFDVGDVVSGWGRIGRDDEGVWLDLTRVRGLGFFRHLGRDRRSVPLVGGDFSAVPTEFGPNNAIPGTATVTGRWLGDAIEVYDVAATGPVRTPVPERITPPCPAPPGGWPLGAGGLDAENLRFDAGDLSATGAAESLVWFCPGPDQVVLVVTATDIDAVEAVLRPKFGDRLCVVPSRWTSRKFADVLEEASGHWRDWSIDSWSGWTGEDAQNLIEIVLLRVTVEIATWANAQPDGLILLQPSLAPASIWDHRAPGVETAKDGHHHCEVPSSVGAVSRTV